MGSFGRQDDAGGAGVDVNRAQVHAIQRVAAHHEDAREVLQRKPLATNVMQIAQENDRFQLLSKCPSILSSIISVLRHHRRHHRYNTLDSI